MTNPPTGFEPPEPTPAPSAEVFPSAPASPSPSASGPTPPSNVPSPSRSVLVSVLTLLVTLLLGIMIGLILSRTILAPEPDMAATSGPSATETPAYDQPTADASSYPQAPSDDVLAVMEAQFRRDADDPFALGAVDAPVVLAEWADFRCSYCARFHLETLPALQRYIDEGLVRYEWNDFPVLGPESEDLAVAARAAADQGRFHEMNDAITSYQFVDGGSDFSNENLVALAEEAGVPDLDAFAAVLEDSADARTAIQASYDNAAQIFGTAATPQFVVNAQYIGGFLDAEDFTTVIEQELQRIADNG